MSGLKLILPIPPSVNTYHRNFHGRMVISAEGRKFKKDVAEYVAENRFRKFWDARVSVFILLHPRDRREIDIDNRMKPTLDALQDAGVFNNDKQVDIAIIKRANIIKGGRAVVYVEEIRAANGESEKINDFRPAWDKDGSELAGSSRCPWCKQDCSKEYRDQSAEEVKA